MSLTFKVKRLMPLRVQCSPLDLGLQLVFLVRQKRHPHVGVAGAAQILGGELLRLGTEREETHEAGLSAGGWKEERTKVETCTV